MTDLLAARSQMAMSLAFHIVFAVAGMAMPLLMVLAERRWLKHGDAVALDLAKRWAKGTAVLFAVGAVSGTVLSFELGLLWPRFMAFAGPVIGMPFSLEGFAFFLEAIFLGIYLYGWDGRVTPRLHWFAGIGVAINGTLSAVFVVTVNAWMNTPVGYAAAGGQVAEVDVLAAMLSPAAPTQVIHMVLAAFVAVGFGVAGLHAVLLLRQPGSRFHTVAFEIAFAVGAVSALLQPLSGDFSAKMVARTQPIKLAAMEGQWETERGAPIRLGGWPDEKAETTRWAIEIPKGLSILAHFDPDAEIVGLKAVPPSERPPVAIVHIAFQIMVLSGLALAAVALIGVALSGKKRKKKLTDRRWFLKSVAWVGPLGIVAIEAGWTVTEVGRQPWIISGVMRTADAVTPMPGLVVPFTMFTLLYLVLAGIVVALFRRIVLEAPRA